MKIAASRRVRRLFHHQLLARRSWQGQAYIYWSHQERWKLLPWRLPLRFGLVLGQDLAQHVQVRGQRVQALLEPHDAPGPLSHQGRIDLPGHDHVGEHFQAGQGQLGLGAHEDDLAAGQIGLYHRLLRGHAAHYRAHLQIVAEHHALVAQLVAQHFLDYRWRKGGRPLWVQGRVHRMTDHHSGHPGPGRGHKGRPLHCRQLAPGQVHGWPLLVGVQVGAPQAWEVLGAGQAAGFLHALDKSRAQGGHPGRVAPQAAPGHDAILDGMHIQHRGHVPVEARGHQLAAHAGSMGGQGLLVRPSQVGQVRAVGEGLAQAGHAAPLLVHQHEQGGALGLGRRPPQVIAEPPHLGRGLHVAREQDHPAEALLGHQGQVLGPGLGAGDAHHQRLGQAVSDRAPVHCWPSASCLAFSRFSCSSRFCSASFSFMACPGKSASAVQVLAAEWMFSALNLRSAVKSALKTRVWRTRAVANRARGIRQVTRPCLASTFGSIRRPPMLRPHVSTILPGSTQVMDRQRPARLAASSSWARTASGSVGRLGLAPAGRCWSISVPTGWSRSGRSPSRERSQPVSRKVSLRMPSRPRSTRSRVKRTRRAMSWVRQSKWTDCPRRWVPGPTSPRMPTGSGFTISSGPLGNCSARPAGSSRVAVKLPSRFGLSTSLRSQSKQPGNSRARARSIRDGSLRDRAVKEFLHLALPETYSAPAPGSSPGVGGRAAPVLILPASSGGVVHAGHDPGRRVGHPAQAADRQTPQVPDAGDEPASLGPMAGAPGRLGSGAGGGQHPPLGPRGVLLVGRARASGAGGGPEPRADYPGHRRRPGGCSGGPGQRALFAGQLRRAGHGPGARPAPAPAGQRGVGRAGSEGLAGNQHRGPGPGRPGVGFQK
eukprot:TRINITY_DN10197_c0_g2_i3.p1 TRINITY_DN10197_c0_g2~~TRINITY_DN10197_c0_g2_i3.p1  ORF type:complete len:879 (+),score=214.46 TRINITY_DN10197_c0_g2_i3:495-3131(+)